MNCVNFQDLEIFWRCIFIIVAYVDILEVKEAECFQFPRML